MPKRSVADPVSPGLARSREVAALRAEVERLRADNEVLREGSGLVLDDVERLREAMADAVTSLETGPMTDGYAAHVLRTALSA